jgi:hypothetical protein
VASELALLPALGLKRNKSAISFAFAPIMTIMGAARRSELLSGISMKDDAVF